MSFMESIRTVLSKYADFNGRARLSEYWWYALAYTVVILLVEAIFVFPAIGQMSAATATDPTATTVPPMMVVGYVIVSIIALGLFLPSLAVSVRRLHDSDKSGFFILLGLIPFVGPIIVLVLMALPGTAGQNRFGPDPKAAEVPAQA
ncbi:DUF805 domain-containing protein [Myceligenerans pegani]|uniref:DUF805 domain-containing protein n=1 Tax=Myceligenerans pegani TaxID=2776917 RepID=A0ABR9MZI4_9MICO|nr:DUF805 domain-containing protein [Myceligenerans sp. TRM 65318]MBE1876813.1 DUF805 domain-containing protein [Myceligenerans sp. TRM 65318]MBE3019084.1 DUF805 domain-containing protein [Myceligenerans sp. TRM 65318]